MTWGQVALLSGYVFLCGVVVLTVAITCQVLAPQGQVGEVEITRGVGVRVGEQTLLNYLGEALIAMGVVGSVISSTMAVVRAQRFNRTRRRQRRRSQAVAERAEPLLAKEMSLPEVRRALAADGIAEPEIARGLQLDWPRGERCPQCGESARQFTHLRRPRFHCTNCGWIGEQAAPRG